MDPAEKKHLRAIAIDSLGLVTELTIRLEGKDWIHEGTLLAPDGKRTPLKFTSTVASDRTKHTNDYGTHKDVWTRVKKSR